MVSYPDIPESYQHNLPALTAPAVPIPPAFSDSTHQLWACETVDGPMVLKNCQTDVIHTSAFWQGMNYLFKVQFPDSLDSMPETATDLRQLGTLVVPEVVAAASGRFVLTRTLSGQDVDASLVTDEVVSQLARHLGQLHQQQSEIWGHFPAPHLVAQDWPVRLQATLTLLNQQSPPPVPDSIFNPVMSKAADINPGMFVPVMPDLRWDQFRLLPDNRLAVLDLDAFVTAPAALELTLLEYLLDASQAEVFARTYQQYQPLLLSAQEREVYRLLLFMMYVLGEQDVSRWMTAPTRF